MTYQHISVVEEGDELLVTMCRPRQRNALS